jgi:8-oxo-dGTP pyrophosphatase MutT (NUDIX family)
LQPAESKEPIVSKQKGKLLSSNVVFTGKVFSVRHDEVSEPGGVVAGRDIVVHPGSVVVMPVFPDGKILLIRQYRHTAQNFLWELVAGRIDQGESPVAAGHRELAEETGYTARRLKKLLEIFPSPGFVDEVMWIFAATGLTQGAARPEEDERIEARRLSLREAERMIRTGKLRDAKSIAGILYYQRFMA